MADKLIACTCGGNGITVDAEPPKEERESWERHGFEPPRHYAVRCDKCGKQTGTYKLKTPAWKEWNRLNKTKCKYKLFNAKQKAMVAAQQQMFMNTPLARGESNEESE